MPFPTLPRQANAYSTYKSPYGPKYHYQPHFGNITARTLFKLVPTAAGFGSVALFAVIFFTSGIPKIQNDVLRTVFPFLGPHFDKKILPASDNPF
ncbi:ubiquinol-cytochrome-c reductase complex subunit-domain-containing protein [Cercophora scortea]|uniref:Ubiquinol-cytochrome-c reductase complex subunit-domain-containing protein n=1 Tax=Cercophora scortea TaxID=314031 RepID=A0AAE0IGC2_9PEZI|nr:ubiquinol-cytochrome-c reductase complex subunit-domain-containing protein [Cercophora scortea]